MSKTPRTMCAVTVAGSDSGGGAGMQADLKTFAALGVHGASAVTCLTAQGPTRIRRIQAADTRMVYDQLNAIFDDFPPTACKLGMLYSKGIVETVARFFGGRGRVPLVVDPVMIATSGGTLLRPSAVRALETLLLPMAHLVTPNLHEAERLTGFRVRNPEEMRAAAKELHRRHACAVLVKGGHLRGTNEAVDVFYDGASELLLSTPYLKGVKTHGTGCTYSAAITAYLSRGESLPTAVKRAKEYIAGAIAHHQRVGRQDVLHWLWKRQGRP